MQLLLCLGSKLNIIEAAEAISLGQLHFNRKVIYIHMYVVFSWVGSCDSNCGQEIYTHTNTTYYAHFLRMQAVSAVYREASLLRLQVG